MSQFPDYYKLLDIPQTATQEEIRHAYRKESLKFFLPPSALSPVLQADY
jgi:DnaJ-class molecular chaperone